MSSKFLLHTGAEIIVPKAKDMVVIKGNLTAAPKLTEKGMCYIPIAWERADKNGKAMPTQFISVKCWGADAQQAAQMLSKGDRVRIEAERLEDTYPDTRTEEQKAKYPRDGYEYRLDFLEVYFKKPEAAVAPAPKTEKRGKKSAAPKTKKRGKKSAA